MSMSHIVGVDPGLVHTGVVSMEFLPWDHQLNIKHVLIDGPNAIATRDWVYANADHPQIFVEAYRPRMHLQTDGRMQQAEAAMRVAMPSSRFLPNMGIKRVITQELMELLEVWKFPTTSHHQDLRSAARIGLLGMVKEPVSNRILAKLVKDYSRAHPWTITHS